MKKSRILCWILCLVVALALFMGEGWFRKITAEKSQLYVYAPKEMEKAFDIALKSSELKDDYKIVIINDASKANIMVEMGKEFDPEYTKIAYSPFVVVYNVEDKNIKNMIKSGLLQDAFFDDDYKEINFSKVIEEVVAEGKWENFGVKDMGTIKVYYPAPGTKYYTDYYDFMLVTVNDGTYPKSESELKEAMEQIERFENSNYTEGVKDFNEKFERTGGFMENALWLVPEQEVYILVSFNQEYGRLFYPTTTVYTNYYVKADELGNKLVAAFDDTNSFRGNFYDYIAKNKYRNDWDNELKVISDWLYGDRDVYNVLHLDEDRIRPESLESKPENSADTKETGETPAG